MIEIYTIGFTQTSAEQFFESLKQQKIKRLIDVRLNNSSQLSGFSKKKDLEYFLRAICACEYVHMPILAPTQEMRDQYRSHAINWDEYAKQYVQLIESRKIENYLDKDSFNHRTIFLCTEKRQEDCHRLLLVEYLNRIWGDVHAIPV